MSEKHFLYKSTMSRVYGLTPSMIKELEPPDLFVDNPYYTNAAPGCLFRIDRVEAWIEANHGRVTKARASRKRRAAAQKKRHEKQRNAERNRALKWLESVPLSVKPLTATLLDDAKEHYTFSAEFDFGTDKGLRAYVRHFRTNYHDLLQDLREFDAWLVQELYSVLRERIDTAVDGALQAWEKEFGHLLLEKQEKEDK